MLKKKNYFLCPKSSAHILYWCLQVQERRRRVERRVSLMLGERVSLARSGSNVQLTITSLCLRLSGITYRRFSPVGRCGGMLRFLKKLSDVLRYSWTLCSYIGIDCGNEHRHRHPPSQSGTGPKNAGLHRLMLVPDGSWHC